MLGVGESAAYESLERFGFSQRDEPAEGAFGVGHGRVDEDPAPRIGVAAGVDPFGETGRAVAAFQGDGADQQMGKRVQGEVARSGPTAHRVELDDDAVGIAVPAEAAVRLAVRFEELRAGECRLPGTQQVLAHAEEDPFSAYLAGRHPGRLVAGDGRAGDQVRFVRVRGVEAGEADEGAHLA
jgi:hypothetical protein